MTVSTVPKTVLIIDDEPSIVDLLKDILESANYRAIGVVKWTDAVDAIGHEKPSLILLDLKMPTIDGPSLLEFLRKEGVQIPVIIVSGLSLLRKRSWTELSHRTKVVYPPKTML